MKEKKDKAPEITVTDEKAPEVKKYEWSNLVVKCKCGATQVLNKHMQDGVQLVIMPAENSFIKLICDKCDAELKLCFEETEAPPAEEEVVDAKTETSSNIQNESIQEEDKQETSV